MAADGDALRTLFLYGASVRAIDDSAKSCGEDGHEPVQSLKDAALWLRVYHPERLEAWLMRQEPQLRHWLGKQPAPKAKVALW